MNARSRQRGIALITAVVLVALATVLATAIAFNTAMGARRAAGAIAVEQGFQIALGAEGLAAYALREDANGRAVPGQATTPGTPPPAQATDDPRDKWAERYGPVEVAPGVSLEAQLADENGKFNLNTLVDYNGNRDPQSATAFSALLRLLQIDPKFAELMVDWIDRDTDPSPAGSGAEDNVYTAQTPGYRAANRFVTSVSELMQLPGMTRADYLKLLPHVSALPPQDWKLNVCFATREVLDAFLTAAEDGSLQQENTRIDDRTWQAYRAQACFPDLQTYTAGMNGRYKPQIVTRVTNKTVYFGLRTWVTIGTTRFALYSLLMRDPTPQNQGQVITVQRSFSTE